MVSSSDCSCSCIVTVGDRSEELAVDCVFVDLAFVDLVFVEPSTFFLFFPPKKPNCLSTEDMELRTDPYPDPDPDTCLLCWSSFLLYCSILPSSFPRPFPSFSLFFLARLSPTDSLWGSLQSTSNILGTNLLY